MPAMQAVIFDVDGVLIDSYQAHLQSWQELARETKVAFSVDDFASTFGQTSRDIIMRFWSRHDVDDTRVRELDDRKEANFRHIIEERFPAMDGAVELVNRLKAAGFMLALGSSGPPANIRLVVEKLGLLQAIRFDAIVTGEDVTRGKPDPQVFLLAAQRLGVTPASCAVIEDAPAGITAAKAAGMAAIALRSTGREKADFSAADLVVNSLKQLNVEVIGHLIAKPQAAAEARG